MNLVGIEVIDLLLMWMVFFGWVVLFSSALVGVSRAEYICACSGIMITLYLFACLQLLSLGIIFVVILGVVGIGLALWKLLYTESQKWTVIRVGVELSAIFTIAFFASWGANYWAWDEFSHWGAQIEFLITQKNLPVAPGVLIFPDYIPGISLFRYFGEVLLKGTGISASYFLTWVMALSGLYAISYSESKYKFAGTAVAVFFAYLIFFQALVSALYVDPLQAVIFLCALKFAHEKGVEAFKVVAVLCVSLVLMKHVGLIFSFFVLVYFFAVRVFLYKEKLIAVFPRALFLLGLVCVGYFTWVIYVGFYGLSRDVVDVSKLSGGAGVFANLWKGLLVVLNNKFVHAGFIDPLYVTSINFKSAPVWFFVAAIFALSISLVFCSSIPSRNKLIAVGLLIATNVSYTLFLAYIAAVTPWGQDPYSFSRYLMVVLFATFLMQFLVVRNHISTLVFAIFVAAMVSFSTVVSPSLLSVFVTSKRPPVMVNEEYRLKAEKLKKYANENDLVWYVNDQNITLGYFIFKMKAMPLKFIAYSAGYDIYHNNNLERGINLDYRQRLFARKLCSVKYIYIDNMSPLFWNQFSRFFDVAKGAVYEVVPSGDKTCTARLVSM